MQEYLDVRDERVDRKDWSINLEAIEGCENYRNPVLDYIYHKVHFGDARGILPKLGRFDLILIADVIEFSKRTPRAISSPSASST